MISITLLDNRFGDNGQLLEKLPNPKLSNEQKYLLREFSGKTLKELREEGVVVFPDSGSTSDKLPFFTIAGDKRIDTGNLMGVLRLRGSDAEVKIQIHSRFDEGNKQFFLNHLLSKVFDLNFAESVSSGESDVMDILLAHGFLQGLARAGEAVGAYKQYRKFYCNDLNFKGHLDLDRHIKRNCPLWDKIAYIKREITFDNPLNHLLLSALKKIESRWPGLIDCHDNCREIIHFLKQNTPTWLASDVRGILSHRDCRETLKHPLFAELYEPLRKLARLLLEEESANVFEDEEEQGVSGVIFDGAWLWEEYLARILTPLGFIHALRSSKEAGTEGIHVFRNERGNNVRPFYPDFRKPQEAGELQKSSIVLDAKYKRGNGDNREDVHQVLCYMYLTGAEIGGLIYPPKIDPEDNGNGENEGNSSNGDEPKIIVSSKEINTPFGNEYQWKIYRFPKLRSYENFSDYKKQMLDIENSLCVALKACGQ